MSNTVTYFGTDRGYRLDVVKRLGLTPHRFVPGYEKIAHLVACAVCDKYEKCFAHDEDLRAKDCGCA